MLLTLIATVVAGGIYARPVRLHDDFRWMTEFVRAHGANMWNEKALISIAAYLGAYLLIFLGSLVTVVAWTNAALTWEAIYLVARRSALFAAALGIVFMATFSAKRKDRAQGHSSSP